MCRVDDCEILVRFDQSPAQSFAANEPDTGESDVIFLSRETTFIRALRKASQVTIAASFYTEGERTLNFRVTGLDWPLVPGEALPPPVPQWKRKLISAESDLFNRCRSTSSPSKSEKACRGELEACKQKHNQESPELLVCISEIRAKKFNMSIKCIYEDICEEIP